MKGFDFGEGFPEEELGELQEDADRVGRSPKQLGAAGYEAASGARPSS